MQLLDNLLRTQRTTVACSVGRLHLLTLAPSGLRLVAQIVASDDTASGTLSQHFIFVERRTARRTGSRHSRSQHRPRDTSVPGKPDHTIGTCFFRDDINHSYISHPKRTGHSPINGMERAEEPVLRTGELVCVQNKYTTLGYSNQSKFEPKPSRTAKVMANTV